MGCEQQKVCRRIEDELWFRLIFVIPNYLYRNKSVRARLDQPLQASSTIYLLGIVDLAEARLLGHVLALGSFGSSRRATGLCGVLGLEK